MDRLISENAVLDAIYGFNKHDMEVLRRNIKAIPSATKCDFTCKYYSNGICLNEEKKCLSAEPKDAIREELISKYQRIFDFLDDIKDGVIPSAFKGLMNGEVIKMVFPNADIEYRKISVYVTISPLTNLVIFDKDWWNSPYSEGSKNE